MNPFPSIGRFFVKIGTTIGRLAKDAFSYASALGFNEDVVSVALKYVKLAEATYIDNTAKREFVVEMLLKAFPQLPESVVRYALETAFQLLKHELDDHLPQ